MADPHHQEPLDGHDRLTVRLYRAGIGLGAVAVLALAGLALTGRPLEPARLGVLAATALIVPDLHLYDRAIRWFVGAAGWSGAVLAASGAVVGGALGPWLVDAGLGFSFVVLSAVALKEQWCFRVPLMPLVPALLAISLIPLRAGSPGGAAPLWLLAGGLLLLLAWAKARMPLHYDIGDRSRYQV